MVESLSRIEALRVADVQTPNKSISNARPTYENRIVTF